MLALLVVWAAVAVLALAASGAAAAAPLPRLGAAPNFALTTHRHDRLWLTHLRGRVVVLTFTCTACDACPGLLPALRDLARALGDAAGRRVFFVAVTVDPRRDTPAALRTFARAHDLDPSAWLLLTGKASEIDLVAHQYGAAAPPGGGPRRCPVTLIDAAGAIRGRYAADEIRRLPDDVHALLEEPPGS